MNKNKIPYLISMVLIFITALYIRLSNPHLTETELFTKAWLFWIASPVALFLTYYLMEQEE